MLLLVPLSGMVSTPVTDMDQEALVNRYTDEILDGVLSNLDSFALCAPTSPSRYVPNMLEDVIREVVNSTSPKVLFEPQIRNFDKHEVKGAEACGVARTRRKISFEIEENKMHENDVHLYVEEATKAAEYILLTAKTQLLAEPEVAATEAPPKADNEDKLRVKDDAVATKASSKMNGVVGVNSEAETPPAKTRSDEKTSKRIVIEVAQPKIKADEQAQLKAKAVEEAPPRIDAAGKAEMTKPKEREEVQLTIKAETVAVKARVDEEIRLRAEAEAVAAVANEKANKENQLRLKAEIAAAKARTEANEQAWLRAEAEAAAAKARARADEESRVRTAAEAVAAKARTKANEESRLRAEAEAAVTEARARADEERRIRAEAEAAAAKARTKANEEARLRAEAEAIAAQAGVNEEKRLRAEAEVIAMNERAKMTEEARVRAEAKTAAARIQVEEESRLRIEAEVIAVEANKEARLQAETDAITASPKANEKARRLQAKGDAELSRHGVDPVIADLNISLPSDELKLDFDNYISVSQDHFYNESPSELDERQKGLHYEADIVIYPRSIQMQPISPATPRRSVQRPSSAARVIRTKSIEKISSGTEEVWGRDKMPEYDNHLRRYVSTKPLREAVERGDFVLLDGQWLIDLCKQGDVLPCRQELPHESVIAARDLDDEAAIKIFAVSCPWMTPQHPDPTGVQLCTISKIIQLYMRLERKRVAVFWDWSSMFQRYYPGTNRPPNEYPEDSQIVERSKEEEIKFKASLAHVHEFFCNKQTVVLLQTNLPDEDIHNEVAVNLKSKLLKRRDNIFELLLSVGIRCVPKSTVVESVEPGSIGDTAGVIAGLSLSGIDPCEQFNDQLVPVACSKDGSAYFCGRFVTRENDKSGSLCSSEELCDSCLRLQKLMVKEGPIEVGERICYDGHLAVVTEYGRSGDFVIRYLDDGGKRTGVIKKKIRKKNLKTLNRIKRLTLRPFDATARAACRTKSIFSRKDAISDFARYRDATECRLLFKRARYSDRGWCELERRLSDMMSPQWQTLDINVLSQMMDTLGCATDLEAFVTKHRFPERRGTGAWKEFMQMGTEIRGNKTANLTRRRKDAPMLPSDFDYLLERRLFTNTSDRKLVSKKYRQVFNKMFASSVNTLDFSGLGWAFPIMKLKAFAGISSFGLRVLKLAKNDLCGEIDHIIRMLVALEIVDVSDNTRLEGSLDAFQNCVSLRELYCNNCRMLTGTLARLGTCTKLVILSLKSCVGLTGTVNAIGNCMALEHIDLSCCRELEGTLDAFNTCTKVKILRLAGHDIAMKFTGTLDALSNCIAVSELLIANCQYISGTLNSLRHCKALVLLDCRGCVSLSGTLGPLRSCSALESIECAGCSFVGSLDDLDGLVLLKNLNVGGCSNLAGTLDVLQHYDKLESLILRGCQNITGTLDAVGECTALRKLDCARCVSLSGTLKSLCTCTAMRQLNCSNCEMLTGTLDALGDCSNLNILILSNCIRLTGNLNALGFCTGLVKIDIAGCFFNGTLDALRNCRKLMRLNCRFGINLEGTVDALGDCPLLTNVDTYGCWALNSTTMTVKRRK